MKIWDSIRRKNAQTYTCARCKKPIDDSQTHWIGNHRFCAACAAAPKIKAEPTPPKKEEIRRPHQSVPSDAKCARCKKPIDDSQTHWIGNHRFCAACAAAPKVKAEPKPAKKAEELRPCRSVPSDVKDIIQIEYFILFDYPGTLLEKPVVHKVAIDARNGSFYLLWEGKRIHKITDERFLEIVKEVSPAGSETYRNLPRNKTEFIKACTLPRQKQMYQNTVSDRFTVSDFQHIIELTNTSLDGWILSSSHNRTVLGKLYFYENNIHDFVRLVHSFAEDFDANALLYDRRLLEKFRLMGNCGYAPLQLMGSEYTKDPFRKHSDAVTYCYEDGILYISGHGATAERDVGGDCGRCCSQPECSVFCKYILEHTQKIVFGEGITKIGMYFLSDFTCLEEILLSSTVEVFDKQSYSSIFKSPPVKRIYLYPGQSHPFGSHVQVRKMTQVFCKDRCYLSNGGFWDRACCLLFEGKEYYYYFKEIGNNQGYPLGQEVFEFDRTGFHQCKNKSFDRNTPMLFITRLPHGDRDWLRDADLLNRLVQIKKQKHPARQVVPEKRSGSEDADIISGREPVNKQDLLFYRKNTPGKGDSEVVWVLLQPVDKGYRAVYKCAYAGCGEAVPSLDTIQTKELPLPCSLVTDRDYRNLIKTLNQAFRLNLTAENCVGYSHFFHWVSYVLGESPVIKPSNPVLDRVWVSLSRKEFANLLLGKDGYFFSDREYPGIHDYGAILSSGIYLYNSQDETLKSVFEETLLQLIHGSKAELLTAFEYIRCQKISEYRGTAPFSLDPKCVEVLKAQILTREAELKQYKERYEFGSRLQEGAWEYIHNTHRSLEEEYGKQFF